MEIKMFLTKSEAGRIENINGTVECHEIENVEHDIFAEVGMDTADDLLSVTITTDDPSVLAQLAKKFPTRVPVIQ